MSNSRARWSPEDDKRLLELKAAGVKLAVIAKKLGRTHAAVDSRINVLKSRIARRMKVRHPLEL
jgi:hypothetical protein